jgi:hypothetical protein
MIPGETRKPLPRMIKVAVTPSLIWNNRQALLLIPHLTLVPFTSLNGHDGDRGSVNMLSPKELAIITCYAKCAETRHVGVAFNSSS